jgi:hypothetical protein
MRGSGAGSLSKVSELLGATHSVVPPGRFRAFLTSVLASGLIFFLGLLVVAYILVWLAGPVSELFHKDHPDQSFWPTAIYAAGDESSVGDELLRIAFPMAICLVVATWLMPRRRLEDRSGDQGTNRSLATDFLIFFQSGASVFFLCVVLAVAIKTGQLFTEYSGSSVSKESRSLSTWLILAVIQSFVAVAVCFFTTWYLASSRRKAARPTLSLTGNLLAIAGVIGIIAFLYDYMALEEYLRSHPKFGTLSKHWEHVLFSVVANVLVSLCAFGSIAVFDKARQTLKQHNAAAAAGASYQPAT